MYYKNLEKSKAGGCRRSLSRSVLRYGPPFGWFLTGNPNRARTKIQMGVGIGSWPCRFPLDVCLTKERLGGLSYGRRGPFLLLGFGRLPSSKGTLCTSVGKRARRPLVTQRDTHPAASGSFPLAWLKEPRRRESTSGVWNGEVPFDSLACPFLS